MCAPSVLWVTQTRAEAGLRQLEDFCAANTENATGLADFVGVARRQWWRLCASTARPMLMCSGNELAGCRALKSMCPWAGAVDGLHAKLAAVYQTSVCALGGLPPEAVVAALEAHRPGQCCCAANGLLCAMQRVCVPTMRRTRRGQAQRAAWRQWSWLCRRTRQVFLCCERAASEAISNLLCQVIENRAKAAVRCGCVAILAGLAAHADPEVRRLASRVLEDLAALQA